MNTLNRRHLALIGASLLLAGCAAPLPATVMLRLPVVSAEAGSPDAGPALRLLSLRLAGHLDRETLVVATGPGTLQASEQARWAEPLRDAAARALQHDLNPAGVAGGSAAGLTGVRVELQAFELRADRRAVRLEAVWEPGSDIGGIRAGQRQRFVTEAPAAGTGLDDAVLAHREALSRLARHIRQQVARPAG